MTNDNSIEALDLERSFGHWGEHPDHPVADWQAEVANDETRLGYWYWVEARLDSADED
jgi:hypothetical protein